MEVVHCNQAARFGGRVVNEGKIFHRSRAWRTCNNTALSNLHRQSLPKTNDRSVQTIGCKNSPPCGPSV